MDNLSEDSKIEIERKYVKTTYDEIANDFSNTRYKKWPKVDSFLTNLSKHSLLLDVGCGNGKYLNNSGTLNIGCDISSGLLKICKSKNFEVIHCDMTQLPFRKQSFDALICIAALHHIVSVERRQNCLASMIELLVVGGVMFIQVWAFEQKLDETKYLSTNKMSHNEATPQDTMEIKMDESVILPIHKNRTPFVDQEMLVPFKYKTSEGSGYSESLRYYHLFKEGELDDIILNIPGAKLVDSFYDQGNWCGLIERC